MRVKFNPQDPQQLNSHITDRGYDVGYHQIRHQVAQHRHIEYGHLRNTPVDPDPDSHELIKQGNLDTGGLSDVYPLR